MNKKILIVDTNFLLFGKIIKIQLPTYFNFFLIRNNEAFQKHSLEQQDTKPKASDNPGFTGRMTTLGTNKKIYFFI